MKIKSKVKKEKPKFQKISVETRVDCRNLMDEAMMLYKQGESTNSRDLIRMALIKIIRTAKLVAKKYEMIKE